MRRMIEGDERAFERFSDEYIPLVYRFASRRLRGDRELTRDLVQSTVCKAIAKLHTFRGEAALATWLCACCRNEIAAHFRRAGRWRREVELTGDEVGSEIAPFPTPSEGPEGALLRKERSELVHLALDALPPRYGQALEWKYLENLPVKEIARRLEVGPKAAESLLTRARHSFRDGFARLARGVPKGGEPDVAQRRTVLQP